jgi:hypothetical protein
MSKNQLKIIKPVKSGIIVDYVGESFEHIYLVQTTKHKNESTDSVICKFGKTSQLHNRFKSYPRGTIVHLVKRVKNCGYVEDQLKLWFPKNFVQERGYGIEYFSGKVSDMIECINKIIMLSNQELEDENIPARIRTYYKGTNEIAIGKEYDEESSDEEEDFDSENDIENVVVDSSEINEPIEDEVEVDSGENK